MKKRTLRKSSVFAYPRLPARQATSDRPTYVTLSPLDTSSYAKGFRLCLSGPPGSASFVGRVGGHSRRSGGRIQLLLDLSLVLLPITLSLFSVALVATPKFEHVSEFMKRAPKHANFTDLDDATPSPLSPLDASLDPSTADAVTLIRGDISYGSHTPITINRSGVYQLTGPLSATDANTALTISASNVSLDLAGNVISGGATGINVTGNAVSIKNGSVKNASSAGIKISGSKCQLENLDVISSYTGFLLQSTSANQLTNCRTLSSSNAGFSLVSSSTNNFLACQALNTNGGTQAAYGFISQNGYGNNFEQCVAQNTQTASTNGNDLAAGFLLSVENASSIVDSRAQNSLSLTTTAGAYGIYLQDTLSTSTSTPVGIRPTLPAWASFGGINAVSWSSDGHTLAIGGSGTISNTDQLRIYSWNGAALTQLQSITTGSVSVLALAWHYDGHHLAVGTGNQLIVYFWNGSTLTLLQTITLDGWPSGSTINTLSWTQDGSYLAVGGGYSLDGGVANQLRIFSWNGTQISQIQSITPTLWASTNSIFSLAWNYNGKILAIGGNTGTGSQLKIYSWNGSTLTELQSITPGGSSTDQIRSVAWSANGQYLAIGEFTGTGNQLKIYSWNGSALALRQSMTPDLWTITSTIITLAWSNSGQFLAIGGSTSSLEKFKIYTWNGSTLTQKQSLTSPSTNSILNLSWSYDDQYIAVGSQENNPTNNILTIYSGLTISKNCTIQNNTATNNSTAATVGTGIFASSLANYVAQNLSYNNDINYLDVLQSYITSQANDRGVYNINTNLTTPDSVVTINNNVNLMPPEQWSIESKCEVISSKLDRLSLPCIPTNIVSGGTTNSNKPNITNNVTITGITAPGSYCLAANTNPGSITISSDNVVLDLNGFTLNITGATGLTISGNEVTVMNGTIQNATQNGISISGSRCTLANIDVVSSPTGFYLANTNDNTLTNCRALNCTQNGFYLTGSQRNTFSNCSVLNIGGATASSTTVNGFLSSGGKANVFTSCTVNNAFTNVNSASAQASGFQIAGEDYSTITNCTVNGVSTNQTLPNLYGIRCPMILDSVATPTATLNKDSHAVSWLERDGNRYLATGLLSGAGTEVDVFKYTGGGATLQLVASDDWPTNVLDVKWLKYDINNYLAIGSATAPGNDVEVYQFTEPSTLSRVTGYDSGADVNQVSWLTTCTSGSTRYYLAAAGLLATKQLRVDEFNGSTLVARAGINTTRGAQCLDWLTIEPQAYLAAGFDATAGTTAIRIFEFTGNNLIQKTSVETAINRSLVYSVRWLTTNTGKYYLAAVHYSQGAYANSTFPDVALFEFNPTALTLTQIATFDLTIIPGGLYCCSWLPGIDGLNYLAIGSAAFTALDQVRILRFDGSCLSPIITYNIGATVPVLELDWLTTSSTILGVGCYNPAKPVQALGFSPTRNLITNNTVAGVRGGNSATGFAVDANNLIFNNVASNNDTNYYYTPGDGDSNQGYWLSQSTGQ